MNTKQKIINASVQLFNDNGLANVRLQMIADEIGISVGNLAYHFRNKEAIVDAVDEKLSEELVDILGTYRKFPILLDLDNQLTKYFDFIRKYPFYFVDLLEIERAYPLVQTNRKQYISKMISQIRKRFDFNIQRGIIKKEVREGHYDHVANAIWVIITFWVPQQLIKGEEPMSEGEFKQMIWTQFFPYFTEAGVNEFDQMIAPLIKYHS